MFNLTACNLVLTIELLEIKHIEQLEGNSKQSTGFVFMCLYLHASAIQSVFLSYSQKFSLQITYAGVEHPRNCSACMHMLTIFQKRTLNLSPEGQICILVF